MRRNRLRTALFLGVAAVSVLLTAAFYFAPSWKPVKDYVQSTAEKASCIRPAYG